jgi:hypothetical protein
MPGGDRTGPWGQGPMTGRAAGYCAGYGVPGYTNPIPGYGGGGRGFFGRGGRGGGRGWRNWYYATGLPGWARAGWNRPAWGPGFPLPPEHVPESELDTLKAQADYYREALDDITRRIEQLEKAADREPEG